jgi:hypothetical protein
MREHEAGAQVPGVNAHGDRLVVRRSRPRGSRRGPLGGESMVLARARQPVARRPQSIAESLVPGPGPPIPNELGDGEGRDAARDSPPSVEAPDPLL